MNTILISPSTLPFVLIDVVVYLWLTGMPVRLSEVAALITLRQPNQTTRFSYTRLGYSMWSICCRYAGRHYALLGYGLWN